MPRAKTLSASKRTVVSWRKERARELLMESATHLFAVQGIDGTTIDEIVERAGVAKGTFYNHFGDRTAIARALADSMRDDLREAVAALNAGIVDAALRVHRGVRLYVFMAEQNPTRARLLLRLYENVVDPTRHGNERLVEDLASGIEAGRFRVPNAEVALHLVLGLTMAAMRHIVSSKLTATKAEEYRNQIAVLLLQGLGLRATEISSVLRRAIEVPRFALLEHSL